MPVTLFIFPGVLDEARIAGDLDVEDVSCPYCDSHGSCAHLMACIDPLNYNVGGRLDGLDQEFACRVKQAFLPLLIEGAAETVWGSEEISELWDWAKDNWEPGDEEVEIDHDVLFRLITALLQDAARHSDTASQLEGFGVETEYTLVYDDCPSRVIESAIGALEPLLRPKS